MKRKDLIRAIEEIGCVFIRHGGRHDWYQNPQRRKYRNQSLGIARSKIH